MRTFILRFLLFIALVPIAWTIGVVVYGKLAPGFIQKNVKTTFYKNFNSATFKEIEITSTPDVLIAGPSSAFRSFDPRIFKKAGVNIFIMGSSAQSPIQTEYLLDRYIDKLKPKYFIYVADVQGFSADGVEGWLFVLNNLAHYDAALLKATLASKSVLLINTLNYNLLVKPKEKQALKSEEEEYIGKGFISYNNDFSKSRLKTYTYKSAEYNFPEIQKKAFDRIIAKLQARNIPIAIVQTPSMQSYFQRIGNPAQIDEYFAGFKGIPYTNFNYLEFEDEFFWDPIHMNQKGVDRFGEIMLDTLKKWKMTDGVANLN